MRTINVTNSPLLERHNTTTDFLRGDFGLVDWNNGGSNANIIASDDTTYTEKRNTVRSSLEAEHIRYSYERMSVATYMAPTHQMRAAI